MPDKTLRLDLDLYDQVAKVVETYTSPTSTECKPEAPHPGARFPGGAQPNQKEISHAGEI